MKNVKFKAYDNFEDQKYEVIEISFKENKVSTLFRGGLINIYDIEELVLLPYIGLLDNHKNEIYEGDRLEKDKNIYIVSYDEFNSQFIGINQQNESVRKSIRQLINSGFIVKRS